MRSFFYNLDKTMSDAKDNGDKNLYRLCCDVKSFVCEGTFTNYKKAKTLMRYWGDSNSYVSKMTGLEEIYLFSYMNSSDMIFSQLFLRVILKLLRKDYIGYL